MKVPQTLIYKHAIANDSFINTSVKYSQVPSTYKGSIKVRMKSLGRKLKIGFIYICIYMWIFKDLNEKIFLDSNISRIRDTIPLDSSYFSPDVCWEKWTCILNFIGLIS